MCTGHLWSYLELHLRYLCNINILTATRLSISLETADLFKLLTPQFEARTRKKFTYCLQGSVDTQYLERERER